MISYALRQPILAAALGLRYVMKIQIPDATAVTAGSWLFIEIASTDAWASGEVPGGPIRLYAARLPALGSRSHPTAGMEEPEFVRPTSPTRRLYWPRNIRGRCPTRGR